MRKLHFRFLVSLLFALLLIMSSGAFAIEADLSFLSRTALEQLKSEIRQAKQEYHTDISYNMKNIVEKCIKDSTEKYFSSQGISIEWPWFDYTYKKSWNLYSLTTRISYIDNNNKQELSVYGEVYPRHAKMQTVYLIIDSKIVINKRALLPNPLGSDYTTHMINTSTGIDLTMMSLEDLDSLNTAVENELSANHKTGSETSKVGDLVKKFVDDYFAAKNIRVNWPWFDYSYTHDWGCCAETTRISYTNENGEKVQSSVYGEAFNESGDYQLFYLMIGEEVILDTRDQLTNDMCLRYIYNPIYEEAMGLYSNKNYDEARKLFQKIEKFSNSKEMADLCQYSYAEGLFSSGKYEDALSAFKQIADYSDSLARIEECQELINEKEYESAKRFMGFGQYKIAYKSFVTLGEYLDSSDLASQCLEKIHEENYSAATELQNTGCYEEAIAMYKELGDYKDCVTQIANCQEGINKRTYNQGVAAMENGDYKNAISIFGSLGDYADCLELVSHCQDSIKLEDYNNAKLLMTRGHFEEAYDAFDALDGYLDSSDHMGECQDLIKKIDRKITFSESGICLFTKKSIKLNPIIEGTSDDAPQKTELVYQSLDTKIAKVSKDGTVTGLSRGTTTIICSAKDNTAVIGEISIDVVLPVNSIKLSQNKLTIPFVENSKAPQEETLSAIISPENAYDSGVLWQSSNETVATVDENGVVRAVSPGKAIITAIAKDQTLGVKKSTCTVTVEKSVTSITLESETKKVDIGKTLKIKAVVLPEDAANKKLTWESQDKNIATVNNGVVKGVSAGTTIITATSVNGITAKKYIKVIQPPSTFSIAVKTKCIDKNHVGSNWQKSYSIDDKDFSSSTTFTANLDQTVRVCICISENDKNPEYGYYTEDILIDEEIFKKGYTTQGTIYVIENGGRYSGNAAEWSVTITIKKR